MAKPLHCSQNHSPLGAVGANTLKMEPPYRTQYLSNHFLKPLFSHAFHFLGRKLHMKN